MMRLWTSPSLVTRMANTRVPDRGNSSIWRKTLRSWRGSMTTPARCVTSREQQRRRLHERLGVRAPGEAPTQDAMSSSDGGRTVRRVVDEETVPAAVGTRPAEVWGETTRPRSSRSAMTLRTVAGLRSNPVSFAKVREPDGLPVPDVALHQRLQEVLRALADLFFAGGTVSCQGGLAANGLGDAVTCVSTRSRRVLSLREFRG